MNLINKDWVKTLATVAPTIATAIGGPVVAMAKAKHKDDGIK